MSSNYPPGVTGNEPHITGEVLLPATLEVVFKVKVHFEGDGRSDGERLHDEAVAIAKKRIAENDPEVDIDSSYE